MNRYMFYSAWLVVAVLIGETYSQQPTILTDYFTTKFVSNTSYLSSAVQTFANTKTTLRCAAKCSQLGLVSFFYDEQPSLCYCNDNVDPVVVSDTAGGHIQYGFIDMATSAPPTPPPGSATPMFNACNTPSLGWTTFQRRMDGSVDFYRNWTDYVNGFGTFAGEFWLGLEQVHQITTAAAGCELCIFLEAGPNSATALEGGYAMYTHFTLGSAATNYILDISGFSSSNPAITDSLAYHNGYQYTTYDADNDVFGANCAVDYHGAFWYYGCHMVNLNGLYGGPCHQSIKWGQPWGSCVSLLKTEMSFRC